MSLPDQIADRDEHPVPQSRIAHYYRQMVGAEGKVGLASLGTLAASLLGTAIRFGLQFLLAFYMGAAEYGRFAGGRGWGELVSKVPNRGYELTAVRWLPQYENEKDWQRYRGFVRLAQLETLIAGVALGAVIAVAYTVISGNPDTAVVAGMLIVPTLSGITMGAMLLQGAHRVVAATALKDVVQPIIMASLVGGLLLFIDDISAEAVLIVMAAAMGLVALIEAVVVRRSLPPEARSARPQFERATWTRTARFLFIAQLAIAVLFIADLLVVRAVLGDVAAGLYAIATRIAVIGRLVNQALEGVVSGRISRAHNLGDTGAIQSAVDETIRISIVPTIGFAVAATVLAVPILGIFGPEFEAARWVLAILLIGNVSNALTGPSGYVTSMGNDQVRYSMIMAGHAIAMVGLGLLGAYLYGIEGVALAQAAVTVSWNMTLVVVAKRTVGVRCYPRWSMLFNRS